MWNDNPAEAHKRYLVQAGWSRSFREYLYQKLIKKSRIRILEVGCGTGALLECVRNECKCHIGSINGIDLDRNALKFADAGKTAQLLEGNAEKLPFSNGSFDFVFCHYLLLWVKHPDDILMEMKRVTAAGGICAALAEPCYDEMKAEPGALYELAYRQRCSLALKGADTGIGSRLGVIFHSAGFENAEWGRYRSCNMSSAELRDEISLMMKDADFADFTLDPAENNEYEVPTYFAYAVKEQ